MGSKQKLWDRVRAEVLSVAEERGAGYVAERVGVTARTVRFWKERPDMVPHLANVVNAAILVIDEIHRLVDVLGPIVEAIDSADLSQWGKVL